MTDFLALWMTASIGVGGTAAIQAPPPTPPPGHLLKKNSVGEGGEVGCVSPPSFVLPHCCGSTPPWWKHGGLLTPMPNTTVFGFRLSGGGAGVAFLRPPSPRFAPFTPCGRKRRGGGVSVVLDIVSIFFDISIYRIVNFDISIYRIESFDMSIAGISYRFFLFRYIVSKISIYPYQVYRIIFFDISIYRIFRYFDTSKY